VPQTHPRPSSVWAAAEPFDLGTFTGLHLGCRETTSLLPTPTDQLGRRSPALAKSLRDLQGAVRELLETRCPPGVTVREAQQRLGVGKRLAWNIVSFQRASTADDMARVLPGRRGWDAIFDCFQGDDGSAGRIAKVRAAVEAVDRVLDAEGIDRATFSHRAPSPSDRERLARRRDDFARHRSTWPIHGSGKVVAWLVSPDPHRPEMGTATTVQVFHGVERLASGPLLEISRSIMSDETVRERVPPETDLKGLFGRGGALPPLLEKYSSPGVVGREIHPVAGESGGAPRVGLADRDPDRTGPLNLVFGDYLPCMGPLRGGEGDRVTFAVETMAPVEWAVLDLLWRRDLPSNGPWTPRAVGYIGGPTDSPGPMMTFPELGEMLEVQSLGAIDLPAPMTPFASTYRAALRAAAAGLGSTLDDFEVHRISLRYPPVRSSIVASRSLPGA